MPGGSRFAHEMRNHLAAEIEVKINLGAPAVRVRWKGVPHAALGQFSVAHDELATAYASRMDEFADDALIGPGLGTERGRDSFIALHDCRGKRCVGGRTQKEEFRRVFWVLAFKSELSGTGAGIDAGQRICRESPAVHSNNTGAADVDGAEFALFQEKTPAGFGMVREFDFFFEQGTEADARRARALPLIAQEPDRFPDHGVSGPDLPYDERVRRRFFGEE